MAGVSGASGRPSYGISGLVSGLDTDTLVESLTSTTSNKIDEQNRQKQTLAWKQDAYRDISKGITEFVDKYLNTNSKNCIMNSSFFTNYSATASVEGFVNISGSIENSAAVEIKEVSSLAKAASFTCTNNNLVNKLQIKRTSLEEFKWNEAGKTEVTFYLDGKTETVTLDKADFVGEDGKAKSDNEIAAKLNEILADKFVDNNGKPLVKLDANLTFNVVNSSSTFAVSAGGDVFGIAKEYGTQVTVNNTLGSLGLTASGKDKDGLQTYELTLNDKSWTFTEENTISDVLKKINGGFTGVTASFSAINKTFSFKTTSTGADQKIEMSGGLAEELFGYGVQNDAAFVIREEKGRNMEATLIVDGVETKVERNGNSMTFNGLTMEFVKEYSEQEAISFKVDNNTDGVVEKMQEFIDEYNGIINTIHTMITEKPDKDYYALTDAEKEAMSETEIKNWEAKAKEGLLYNDSTLSSLLTSLRSTMYTSVDGSLLAQFGITTVNTSTSSKKNNGQLELNKATFVNALNSDAANLINLFTKNDSGIIYSATIGGTAESNALRKERTEKNGLMQRLSDVFQDMIYTGTPKGKLLQIAGLTGDRTDGDNQLTKKMVSIDSEIDRLRDKLEMERNRYYNKFNAMEEALSKLNSTSSYIASMLGMNNSGQ